MDDDWIQSRKLELISHLESQLCAERSQIKDLQSALRKRDSELNDLTTKLQQALRLSKMLRLEKELCVQQYVQLKRKCSAAVNLRDVSDARFWRDKCSHLQDIIVRKEAEFTQIKTRAGEAECDCKKRLKVDADQCLRDMQWLQAEREEERRTANAAAMAMYNAREADFLAIKTGLRQLLCMLCDDDVEQVQLTWREMQRFQQMHRLENPSSRYEEQQQQRQSEISLWLDKIALGIVTLKNKFSMMDCLAVPCPAAANVAESEVTHTPADAEYQGLGPAVAWDESDVSLPNPGLVPWPPGTPSPPWLAAASHGTGSPGTQMPAAVNLLRGLGAVPNESKACTLPPSLRTRPPPLAELTCPRQEDPDPAPRASKNELSKTSLSPSSSIASEFPFGLFAGVQSPVTAYTADVSKSSSHTNGKSATALTTPSTTASVRPPVPPGAFPLQPGALSPHGVPGHPDLMDMGLSPSLAALLQRPQGHAGDSLRPSSAAVPNLWSREDPQPESIACSERCLQPLDLEAAYADKDTVGRFGQC
eukprot:EG_transcript_9458